MANLYTLPSVISNDKTVNDFNVKYNVFLPSKDSVMRSSILQFLNTPPNFLTSTSTDLYMINRKILIKV